jgi:hypothetical protein
MQMPRGRHGGQNMKKDFWDGTSWTAMPTSQSVQPGRIRSRRGGWGTAALVLAGALVLAAPAGVFAGNGKGGNGGGHGGSGVTGAVSSIGLDQAGAQLALGSPVTFTSNAVGLSGTEYALIYLACTEGGAVVYGQLDLPSTTFVLGGGSSPWWTVGGTATCVGYLEAYGSHGGYDTIRVLAQTDPFSAN